MSIVTAGKNRLLTVLIILGLVTLSLRAIADAGPKLYVNGSKTASEHRAHVVSGTILVPLKDVIEALGGSISCQEGKIIAGVSDRRAALSSGQRTVTVDGKKVQMSLPAKEISGRVYVPVKFITRDFMGAGKTTLDAKHNRVLISAKLVHICPRCHSRNTVPIAYGYPSEAGMEAAKAGEVVLGGCMPGGERWCCKACGYKWGDFRPHAVPKGHSNTPGK